MTRPKALCIGKIWQYASNYTIISRKKEEKEADDHSATDAWNSLSSIADLVTTNATNRAEFLAECRSGRFDGVVAIYRTLSSVQITGRIDAELLDALPSSVRFIANCGTYDQPSLTRPPPFSQE